MGNAQGQELTGAIAEALRQLRWHCHFEGAAVVGFRDNRGHFQGDVFGRRHNQILITNCPLSTRSSMPLTARQSSEAKYSTAPATSSGRQARFIGSLSMVNSDESIPCG